MALNKMNTYIYTYTSEKKSRDKKFQTCNYPHNAIYKLNTNNTVSVITSRYFLLLSSSHKFLPEFRFGQVRKWTKMIARPTFNNITRATRIELGPCENTRKVHVLLCVLNEILIDKHL